MLLISADFLASDYCAREVTIALARQSRGEVHLIPVLLRPSLFEHSALGKLQAIPLRDGRTAPVSSWDDQDEALMQVAQTIATRAATLYLG